MSTNDKHKVIVTKEQINLVSNSECIKRYPVVLDMLNQYKLSGKSIRLSDIERLENDDIQTYNYLRYSFEELSKESAAEWKQAGEAGCYKNRCALCGNPQLMYNYKIRNIKNGNIMIVGSECICKFPNIDSSEFSSKKDKSNKQKYNQRINRINEINTMFPNCKHHMEAWKNYYNDLEVLMPYSIDEKYNELINNSYTFYNEYIEGRIKKNRIEEFQEFYNRFELLRIESQKFINENRENSFICNKALARWLNNYSKPSIRRRIIMDGGIITKNTINAIGYFPFIQANLQILESKMQKNSIVLSDITDQHIEFVIRFSRVNLRFKQDLEGFMHNLGHLLLEDTILDKEEIIEKLELDWDIKNIDNFIWELNNILRKTPYRLSMNFKVMMLDIFKGEYIAQVHYQTFLNSQKKLLFLDEREYKAQVLKVIEQIKRWDTKINREKYSLHTKNNDSSILTT